MARAYLFYLAYLAGNRKMQIKNEVEKKKCQNIGVKIAKVVFYDWGIKKARFAPNVRMELKLVQK